MRRAMTLAFVLSGCAAFGKGGASSQTASPNTAGAGQGEGQPAPSDPTTSLAFVDHVGSGTEFAVHGGHVYWGDGVQVQRIAVSVGGQAERLCPMEARFLAVDDDAFYGEEASGILVRIERRRCEREALASDLGIISRLILDGNDVYWSEGGLWGEAGLISRTPRGGGAVEDLVRDAGIVAFALDEGFVYYATADRLRRVSRAGGRAETLAEGLRDVRDLAIDAGAVYWADMGGLDPRAEDRGRVCRIEKAAGASPVVIAEHTRPMAIAVGQLAVYWLEEEGPVMSAPKAGGRSMPLTPEGGEGCRSSSRLVAFAGALFWLRPARHCICQRDCNATLLQLDVR